MENRVSSDWIALSELRKEMELFMLLSAREQEKTLHALFSRFIEPDRTEYVDPEESLCVNLYAYCGNGPIAHSDPSGHTPVATWIGFILGMLSYPFFGPLGVTAFSYIGACIDSLYDGTVKAGMDAIGWNPFTLSNASAFNAIKEDASVSFYLGAPIFRSDINRSGSFGAIFMSTNEDNPLILKHEWGHIVQLAYMGFPQYLTNTFLPSALQFGVYPDGSNYYEKPWESSASMIGGDWNHDYSPLDVIVALFYLWTAKFTIPSWAFRFALWG